MKQLWDLNWPTWGLGMQATSTESVMLGIQGEGSMSFYKKSGNAQLSITFVYNEGNYGFLFVSSDNNRGIKHTVHGEYIQYNLAPRALEVLIQYRDSVW